MVVPSGYVRANGTSKYLKWQLSIHFFPAFLIAIWGADVRKKIGRILDGSGVVP
jgi:hypothetical protein